MKDVKIGEKIVGDNHRCYLVAEIGGAFKTFEEGKCLIDAVKEIGIDAVKFQTLEADTITTKNNFFDLEITGKISQYDLFKEAEISKELQLKIVQYANEQGITIFSAPSHIKDLEVMKEMDLTVYKIGSDLACHIPLLREVAKLQKPIILSTGMCNLQEIKDSVKAILEEGNDKLILLHCVSDYPTKIEEANLNAINELKKEFDVPVGFSDHTIGIDASEVAISMGANMIERHFQIPGNSPGVDDPISLTKEGFKKLIEKRDEISILKGNGEIKPTKSEEENLKTNRVSIIVMKDIEKGQHITLDMIDIRRPGTGIQPKDWELVIGKRSKENISKESPLTWEMLEEI